MLRQPLHRQGKGSRNIFGWMIKTGTICVAASAIPQEQQHAQQYILGRSGIAVMSSRQQT
jgi:hypothetical protein